MRTISIVTREDLVPTKKLVKVEDAEMADFSCFAGNKLCECDIVAFSCTLTSTAKVIKNRNGEVSDVLDMTSTDGDEVLVSFILGI
jgi:hypothetical protein